MKKGILTLTLAIALTFSSSAYAGDIWENAESDVWGEKFGGMLVRGGFNIITSFMDPVVQTIEGTEEGPPVVGSFRGLGSGVGCGLLRIGSGVIDVVTSWVPDFNGVPVARNYSDCLDFEGTDYVTGHNTTASSAPKTMAAPKTKTIVGADTVAVKKPDRMEYIK